MTDTASESQSATEAARSPVEAAPPGKLPETRPDPLRAIDEALARRRERAALARAEARRHWPATVDVTEQARDLLLAADYLAHYASAIRRLSGTTPTEAERVHLLRLAVSVTEQGRAIYEALSGRAPRQPGPGKGSPEPANEADRAPTG